MTNTSSDTTVQESGNFLSLIFSSNQDSNFIFQIGWTFLRIISGALMIHNGFNKLADVEGFASYVVSQTMGLPFPEFLTYCAAYTQVIGGFLLILGLLTRPAAIGLFFVMMVAIYFHLREDGGFVIASYETALLYASTYLFSFLNGGGSFSVDRFIADKLK